jgi:hypothetical protein
VLFERRGKNAVWRVCANERYVGEVKANAASMLMVIWRDRDGRLFSRMDCEE